MIATLDADAFGGVVARDLSAAVADFGGVTPVTSIGG
jgi:hypothetical protein